MNTTQKVLSFCLGQQLYQDFRRDSRAARGRKKNSTFPTKGRCSERSAGAPPPNSRGVWFADVGGRPGFPHGLEPGTPRPSGLGKSSHADYSCATAPDLHRFRRCLLEPSGASGTDIRKLFTGCLISIGHLPRFVKDLHRLCGRIQSGRSAGGVAPASTAASSCRAAMVAGSAPSSTAASIRGKSARTAGCW